MEYGSNVIASSPGSAAAVAPRRKRRHYRHQMSSLAYVNLNQGNGGIIRDLSENGIAIQAVAPVQANQQVQLSFELLSPRVRLETTGHIAWADSTGQAGVEFVALPQRSCRLLKEWLFTHLLLSAQNAAWNTIFGEGQPVTDGQLQFSAAACPPILLPVQPPSAQVEDTRATFHILGARVRIQARIFSRLVDSLILLAAVLLFAVIGIAMTKVSPSWPTALLMLAVLTTVIACLYGFLFNFWIGTTAGATLAQLACESDEMCPKEENRQRFR